MKGWTNMVGDADPNGTGVGGFVSKKLEASGAPVVSVEFDTETGIWTAVCGEKGVRTVTHGKAETVGSVEEIIDQIVTEIHRSLKNLP